MHEYTVLHEGGFPHRVTSSVIIISLVLLSHCFHHRGLTLLGDLNHHLLGDIHLPSDLWGPQAIVMSATHCSLHGGGSAAVCMGAGLLQFAWGRVCCSLHGGRSAAVCMGEGLLQFAWGGVYCSLHGGGSAAVNMGGGGGGYCSLHGGGSAAVNMGGGGGGVYCSLHGGGYCSLHGGRAAAVCMGAGLLQFAWGRESGYTLPHIPYTACRGMRL